MSRAGRVAAAAPPRQTRAALAALLLATATACSFANLSYAEIERDLDAIVRVEGEGDEARLVFQQDVRISAWYARAWLLKPLKPVLLWLLDDTSSVSLANPSGTARELLIELAPKAGDDLMRCAASAQRLVRVLELDASALNRIVAIDGLARIADARGHDLLDGVAERGIELRAPDRLAAWIEEFKVLRPAAREPVGGPLPADGAARYVEALAGLTQVPLPSWRERLALIADLATAWQQEGVGELRRTTAVELDRAVHHAAQWSVIAALEGQDRQWLDVRLEALALLHRHGGPDSVPLLLAMMASSPEQIAGGTPQFDPDTIVQLRLIHLCGQLDQARAARAVTLPGREDWQRVTPLDFLARIALDQDSFLSPLTLPAREALARSLGRRRLDLVDDEGQDWVRSWYDEYRQRS